MIVSFHRLTPDPYIPDTEIEYVARLGAALVSAGMSDIGNSEGTLGNVAREGFVLLQGAASCKNLRDTLLREDHRALIPRLIVCPVGRGSMNALIENFPVAALIEQTALKRWADTGDVSSDWSGLVGNRTVIKEIGSTYDLIDTDYVMADGEAGALPDLLIRYLELYSQANPGVTGLEHQQ
jgi:hypothetical protein